MSILNVYNVALKSEPRLRHVKTTTMMMTMMSSCFLQANDASPISISIW